MGVDYNGDEDSGFLLESFPPATRLDDIHISIKTSHKFHGDRLPVIIKTWFQLAKEETWFFTDREDQQLDRVTGKLASNIR